MTAGPEGKLPTDRAGRCGRHPFVFPLIFTLTGCALEIGGVPLRLEAQEPAAATQEGDADARQDPEREPGAGQAFEESVEGYPIEERIVGGPTDVDADLATSFPLSDSLFDGVLVDTSYFNWKESLYEDTGIKLGISYQALFQKASSTTTTFPFLPPSGKDYAAGGWLLIEGKWEAYNRGEDFQGGLTAALDWRHGFGNAAEPAFFQSDTGSLWATDFVFLEWDPWFPVLYWEQWGERDRFVGRVGTQTALQMFDFFRFKDSRTSFTSSQFTVPPLTIPFPAPGLGAAFEWWPVEDSPLYVVGTVNDMNAEVEKISWDNAFQYGQFFYGLEVGYNWRRSLGDFDHVHLGLSFADERDIALPGFPNDAGGGFKVAGSKQWDRIVGFGSYTYNTAEGGGFGITLGQQAVNAGVAYRQPFGIRGEAALAGTWARPIQTFTNAPPVWNNLDDQYGVETYWKILLTPDLWVTPSLQFIWDPVFDPTEDFLTVASFKFRLFF